MEILNFVAGKASLDVSPFGAHIISWKPNPESEVFFLSPKAVLDGSKSIRAGVPVIFPQFADVGPMQKHGFARTTEWYHEKQSMLDTAGDSSSKTISFTLQDSPETIFLWPHRFRMFYKITFSESELEMKILVENTDRRPFSFTTALHSYFAVNDISDVEIVGLEGTKFIDKLENDAEKWEIASTLRISEEVDRVYKNAPESVFLMEDGKPKLEISKVGFLDTVVWNPWKELTSKLSDMENDGFKKFVCIESATICEPIVLEPGDRWIGSQVVRLKKGTQ